MWLRQPALTCAISGVPAKYKGRLLYRWNPNVTLMRTAVEENTKMGQIFAEKLNKVIGPVAVMIPMGGLSELDYPGQPFWCSEAGPGLCRCTAKVSASGHSSRSE